MFSGFMKRFGWSVGRSPSTNISQGRPASLVRALAGAPVGMHVMKSRSRRGSFLVLVVGTLAVLSVFAVIYVTIGNQDARTKSAVTKRAALDDVPEQFRDYVGSIIANDTLSTWYDDSRFLRNQNGGSTIPQLWREAMDYPFTGFERRSNSLNPATAFDPTGSFGTLSSVSGLGWTLTGANPWPTSWQPSDPFIASSEPIWLRWAPSDASQDASFPAVDRQDWMHISNLAPDGRFVNLWNLRNNFAAEAGVGNDASGRRRLSENLSVLNVDGSARNTTWFGATVDPNVPAHFDSWQRFLFRPAKDLVNQPGQADYLPNQYADADGDGMFDGRWMTLVEGRLGTSAPLADLLETDKNYRYFFAARVIDLSGRVNVNTATDQLYDAVAGSGPIAEVPIGLSPAEVDLWRILTMTDTSDDNLGASYDGIFNGAAASPLPENYSAYDTGRALFVGNYAATAIRMAHAFGEVPGLFDDAGNAIFRGGDLQAAFAVLYDPAGTNSNLWNFEATPFDRWSSFQRRSNATRDVAPVLFGGTSGYSVRGPFGIEDLSEILARNSVNDLEVTSNLEKATIGRDNSGNGTPPISYNYDPLRSNRSDLLERSIDEDGDGLADSQTLLRFSLDPRQRLTTLSGGRAFRNTRGVDPDYLTVNGSESKLNIRDLLSPQSVSVSALFGGYASSLLAHSNASDLEVWSRSSGDFDKWRTAFYGHNGPELAAYVSGFMALNAADMYDTDEESRRYTLVLDSTFRNPAAPDPEGRTFLGTLDNGSIAPDRWQFPAWVYGQRLDLGDSRLASDPVDVTARAVNLYGIENQPFLTQVATFTVYSDSRSDESAGERISIKGDLTQGNDEALYRVVAFQLTNPFGTDVTLSKGAFQGAEYCDVADPAYPEVDREDQFYYIEFDGRYYKLGELVEQVYVTAAEASAASNAGIPAVGDDSRLGQYTLPVAGGGVDITLEGIKIPAGKTIVCYALSQIPRTILDQRIGGNDPSLTPDRRRLRATIVNLIEDAMDQSTDIEGAYWIPEFAPSTGMVSLPGTSEFRKLVDDGGATVNLWKAVRDGNGDTDSIVDERDTENRPTPNVYWDGAASAPSSNEDLLLRNSMANDQLVDRLRGSGLDAKLPDGLNEVDGTDAGTSDNDGFTITVWATTMRPADPLNAAGDIPRGAFPSYCMEPKYRGGWNVSDSFNPAPLDRDDFVSTDTPAGDSVQNWRTAVTFSDPADSYVPGLCESPTERRGPNVNTRSNPAVLATSDYAGNYPEIAAANNQFASTIGTVRVDRLRVADMLLPWGLGPMQNPEGTATLPPNDLRPDPGTPARWTTLGEAMAMAMGYETGVVAAGDPLGLYQPTIPDPAGGLRTVLDRGNLRLDSYVAFFDDDADLIFTPVSEGGNDTPLGLGTPLAFSVLDTFTAITPGLDSYTRALPGTVNINTAPLTVLRALPMLSPTPDTIIGRPWWWWPSSSLNSSADIAASVTSFRDKIAQGLRPSAAIASGLELVSFGDIENNAPLSPDNPPLHNGRGRRSDIPGVREQPGIQSFGELLGVRYRTDPSGTFLPTGLPLSVDFLGVNDLAGVVVNDSREGVDSILHKEGGAFEIDEIGNEYDEQLAIVNAVSGSTTNRSDYFAVWFVMHGYRESDVTALTPEQPMVPSVARRFLVIYDRSNVTRRGDKPRIVLFKELPI